MAVSPILVAASPLRHRLHRRPLPRNNFPRCCHPVALAFDKDDEMRKALLVLTAATIVTGTAVAGEPLTNQQMDKVAAGFYACSSLPCLPTPTMVTIIVNNPFQPVVLSSYPREPSLPLAVSSGVIGLLSTRELALPTLP